MIGAAISKQQRREETAGSGNSSTHCQGACEQH